MYILRDKWGNYYTLKELTPTAKQQIMDGTLECINVLNQANTLIVLVASPDIEEEYQFNDMQYWDKTNNYTDGTKESTETPY